MDKTFIVIVRLRHKHEKIKKICEDFKRTSESSGEPLEYEIEGNRLIITGCKDKRHAYRIRKFWQKPDFKNLVIYALVKEIML